VEHGRRMSELLPGLVEYVEFEKAGHNDMEQRYWNKMIAHVSALLYRQ
jgi:pimeloyl-ACP methyl ester carboxylesterase